MYSRLKHSAHQQSLPTTPANNPVKKKCRVVFAEGGWVSWEVDKTFNAQRGIEVSRAKPLLAKRSTRRPVSG